MKLSKILTVGFVGLLAGLTVQTARADIMTATWTGTVYSSNSYNNAYNVGDTATVSFTFNTSALGTDNFNGQDNIWENYGGASYGETGFYSDVSYSVGSLSGSFTFNAPYPPDYTLLGSGSNGLTYYENYAYNSNTGYGATAYAYNFTPATNGDPTQTLNSDVSLYEGFMYLYLPTGQVNLHTNHVTVVDNSQSSVPAPGALALLGLGLIGVGGMRRKTKAA